MNKYTRRGHLAALLTSLLYLAQYLLIFVGMGRRDE